MFSAGELEELCLRRTVLGLVATTTVLLLEHTCSALQIPGLRCLVSVRVESRMLQVAGQGSFLFLFHSCFAPEVQFCHCKEAPSHLLPVVQIKS